MLSTLHELLFFIPHSYVAGITINSYFRHWVIEAERIINLPKETQLEGGGVNY